MAQRIRKGDLVKVISGAERGKKGRVMAVDVAKRRVRVEKVRIQKRHLKPGRRGARSGGIVEQEGYVDLSNVALVDPSTGGASRVRFDVRDGKKVRVFAKSGTEVPDASAS
jgi:large subunit ribosomal protein L24